MIRKLGCAIGLHSYLPVSGSRKQTGFAIQHLFFAVHEYQLDYMCTHCRKLQTRFGFVPSQIDYVCDPADHMEDNYWPVDRDGNRLPSRENAGRQILKPINKGYAGPEAKTFKPLFD